VTRLTAAVAVFCFVSSAAASLDRPKRTDRTDVILPALPKELPHNTTEVPPPAEAQLTTETEVYLDGRKCQYKDVPATASVTRMVLAPDGKTITRVEFRTKK
jgi:hypothetical protein